MPGLAILVYDKYMEDIQQRSFKLQIGLLLELYSPFPVTLLA